MVPVALTYDDSNINFADWEAVLKLEPNNKDAKTAVATLPEKSRRYEEEQKAEAMGTSISPKTFWLNPVSQLSSRKLVTRFWAYLACLQTTSRSCRTRRVVGTALVFKNDGTWIRLSCCRTDRRMPSSGAPCTARTPPR